MNRDVEHGAESDGAGPLLSTWLDGELSEPEKNAFGSKLADDAGLRREVEGYRRSDALIRQWYRSLAVAPEQLSFPVPRRPWASLRAAVLAASILLIVGATFWFWLGRPVEMRAEDAIRRTCKSVSEAPGLLVRFEASVITQLERPDAVGNRVEKRTAAGEIRFGSLCAEPLLFRCREIWAATKEEPVLTRTWGQNIFQRIDRPATKQWLKEEQGGNVIFHEITERFDPTVVPLGGPLADERGDGSPVDVRTRQAVEGLAALVRSFQSDRFLSWMGYTWKQEGGKGTAQEPWRYRMELGAPAKAAKGVRTSWTLLLSTSDKEMIDRVELEETVVDVQTKARLSSFRTTYKLELRKEAWPEQAFDAD